MIALLALLASAAAAQQQQPHTTLAGYAADVKKSIPRSETGAFVEPSADERARFARCIEALFENRFPEARECLKRVNYDLHEIREKGRRYVAARERRANSKGQGTYVFDPQWKRNVILEVPHPLFDANTLEESVAILQGAQARALFISGTHRCANRETASGCSGSTTACGGGSKPYVISDAAHFDRNFFTEAHRAALRLDPRPVAISVHGNVAEPVDAELSDGTILPARADAPVIRFRNALEKHGVKVGACNWPADDPSRFRLCGGTNVQGRISNGSPSPCTSAVGAPSGTFIHIEQRRTLRDDPAAVVRAVRDAFPAR